MATEPGGGVVVIPEAFFASHSIQIVALAQRFRLPAVYPYRYYAAQGGLLSYGVSNVDLFRQAAPYIDRILRGAKPSDLPVQQPTRFQLVINIKTAKALNLTSRHHCRRAPTRNRIKTFFAAAHLVRKCHFASFRCDARRAVRLPEGDLPVTAGDGTSKSAASRRFVALSAERLAEWMASDLSKLDLLVIQIDGLHIGNDLVLVAALGIDGEGYKHPLGLVEGATENAAVVQALIDNLIERGLDPKICRLFIIDGAKALSKVIRRTFGAHTPIQRCQIHKARNVIERLPKPLHGSVRRALRQAWELDDADKAERLLRNLARRLDREAPGVAASILEGLDEILTVNRLGVPAKLRRSLACTNSIENMMGTVRRVCRNVKRWRNAAMALRWTAAGMMEAAKGFRRLKAYKQLPILRTALVAHAAKQLVTNKIEPQADAA